MKTGGGAFGSKISAKNAVSCLFLLIFVHKIMGKDRTVVLGLLEGQEVATGSDTGVALFIER